ncbi:MAG: hypothetical protein WCR55_05720, partial [Lentisphaerota bacterium]
ILIFAILHITYISPIINQEMSRTTETLIKDSPAPGSSESSSYMSNPPIPSGIWKNNIFDPARALASEGGATSASLKDVTLLGVFENGDVSGGIFLMSNLPSAGGRPYGGPQGGAQTPYGNSAQQPPLNPKMVFLVGERLPNGFMLKSVAKDSVVLQGGDGSVTLNLEFADENSGKRLAEAQRNNVQQQVKIIDSGKKGAGGSSSSGTNSSSVVIRNAPDSKQGSY